MGPGWGRGIGVRLGEARGVNEVVEGSRRLVCELMLASGAEMKSIVN